MMWQWSRSAGEQRSESIPVRHTGWNSGMELEDDRGVRLARTFDNAEKYRSKGTDKELLE